MVPLPRLALAEAAGILAAGDAVVHLAAVAHTNSANANLYETVNHLLPLKLARDAAAAGAKRFIFMSSTHAVSHRDTPYGLAKARAEADLLQLAGIEVVIVRPPLVYGPGAKGNMASLLALSRLPVPLPFADAQNRRSLIYIDNLVDALAFLLTADGVAGKTFTATDAEAVTLAQIVRGYRQGAGQPDRLFSAPWLPGLLRLMGHSGLAKKMFEEAVFDGSALRDIGWVAPRTADEGLRLTARPTRSV